MYRRVQLGSILSDINSSIVGADLSLVYPNGIPTLPTPPMLQPPPAPMTQAGMTKLFVWTPDTMAEVTAHENQQYMADQSGSTPDVVPAGDPGTDPSSGSGSSWGWYAVAVAAALGLILVVKR